MALSSKLLSAIQRAGQAVHDAQQLLTTALESQASRVAAAMAQKVAVAESETLFKDWKALTELEGEFGAVNARLRDIFAVASKVGRDSAADSTPSVTSKAPSKAKKSPKQRASAAPKGRKAKQVPVGEEGGAVKVPVKRAKKMASVKARAAQAEGDDATGNSTPKIKNDAKVLTFLETALSRETFTPISQTQIAQSAGIPLGSIAAALRKLTEQKLVIESEEKGSYKLG